MKKIFTIFFFVIARHEANSQYLIEFPQTKQNVYQENTSITQGITYFTQFNKKFTFYIIHNFPVNKLDSLDKFGLIYLKSLRLHFEKILPEKTKTVKEDLVYCIEHNRIFFHYHLPTQL